MNPCYDALRLQSNGEGYDLLSFDGKAIAIVRFKLVLAGEEGPWQKVHVLLDGTLKEGYIDIETLPVSTAWAFSISNELEIAHEVNDFLLSNRLRKAPKEMAYLKALMHLGITREEYEGRPRGDKVDREDLNEYILIDRLSGKSYYHNYTSNYEAVNSLFDSALRRIELSPYSDKEEMLAIVKKIQNEFMIRWIGNGYIQDYPVEWRSNRDLVKICLKMGRTRSITLTKELKEDREIALIAVRSWGGFLKEFEVFQDDDEVVGEAVKDDVFALEYASERFQSDRQLNLAIVSGEVRKLDALTGLLIPDCLFKRFDNDREVMLKLLLHYGYCLEKVSESLKKDPEVVLTAYKSDVNALIHASKSPAMWRGCYGRDPHATTEMMNASQISKEERVKIIEDGLNAELSRVLTPDEAGKLGGVVHDIACYRNDSIRDFLALALIKHPKEVSEKIEVLLESPTHLKLPLFILMQWDAGKIPESILIFLRAHRDEIKSKESGALQSILFLLQHLSALSLTGEEKMEIVRRCLVTTDESGALRVEEMEASGDIGPLVEKELFKQVSKQVEVLFKENYKEADRDQLVRALNRRLGSLKKEGIGPEFFDKLKVEVNASAGAFPRLTEGQEKLFGEVIDLLKERFSLEVIENLRKGALGVVTSAKQEEIAQREKKRIDSALFKEGLGRVKLIDVLATNRPETLSTIGDFTVTSLVAILAADLIREGVVDSAIEDFEDKFTSTFLSSRIPTALFTYAGLYIGKWDEYPRLRESILRFTTGVLNGTFEQTRNDDNSHKSYLTPEQLSTWESQKIQEGIVAGEGEVCFNSEQFFQEKIVTDRHAGDKLDRFITAIQSGAVISEPNQLETLCLNLYGERDSSRQLVLLKEIAELLKGDEYAGLQFKTDITVQIERSEKPFRAPYKVKVFDSTDWQDLFLSGTEVLGSCQNVNCFPTNAALMGYVLDGKIRLVKIEDENGKVIARAIVKLLLNEDNKPILFLERIYGSDNNQVKTMINDFVKMKATELGCPVYEYSQLTDVTLHSEGNPAPFEYEDAGLGITNGVYRIRGKLLV